MKRLWGIFVANPLAMVATLFFGLLSIAVSLFDPAGTKQMRMARCWARVLLRFSRVRVTVEGIEHLQPNASYVFLSNHLSYMDTPVILAHVPVQFRFLAKRGLFKIPLLGTHLKQAGHIPVPREDPRAAVRTLQLAAETIRDKKISLLIFPEGGRSHDGVLRSFKEGGAYIGIRAGVPLVPIVLKDTHRILPYGGGVIEGGEVTLRILKPIMTDQLTLKDRGRITEILHELIANELGAWVPEHTLA